MTLKPYNITSFDFQERAVSELFPIITRKESALLIGATGTGKTFCLGSLLHRAFTSGYYNDYKGMGFPVIYITDNSVVTQTMEEIFNTFHLPPSKVLITSYSQLRATIGTLFMDWLVIGKVPVWNKDLNKWEDKDVERPMWKQPFMPKTLIMDECQKIKNPGTLQELVCENYVMMGGQALLVSATPFTKVGEAKVVSMAIKPLYRGPEDFQAKPLYEKNWRHFANDVAGMSDPMDNNQAAVKRLTERLEKGIVRIRGVKFKKRTITHCRLIEFESVEDFNRYCEAYNTYLLELAKIDPDASNAAINILVQTMKFRQEAELIRAPYLARIGKEVAETKKKQIIFGSNFVTTLNEIYKTLIEQGIPKDRISIIKGGQTKDERQRNVALFQTGKSDYCLLTLRSGGVGLSLHHNPKNASVCKPRYVILPPTWSAIELVQVLGRGHRINSISTTHQDIIWYKGTVEEEVAAKLEAKLGCLSELVGKKETWTSVMTKRQDLDSISGLREAEMDEVVDKNEDGDAEEFAAEAFDNNGEEQEEAA